VLLYVLLAEQYQFVSLAKTRDDETLYRDCVNQSHGADSTLSFLSALLDMQSLEIQTATQQKEETSVSV
jgi:hypothetical protein